MKKYDDLFLKSANRSEESHRDGQDTGKKSTFKNGFLFHFINLAASRFSIAVSGILFWYLAAKFCSVEQIGFAAVFFSAASFILFFSSMGMTHVFVRFLPDSQKRMSIFNTLLVFSLALLGFFLIIFFVNLESLLPNFPWLVSLSGKALFLFYVLIFLSFQVLEGLCMAFQRTGGVVGLNAAQNFSRIFLFLALNAWGGLGVVYANGLAALLVVVTGFLFLLPQEEWGLHFNGQFELEAFKHVWSFLLANFLNVALIFLPGTLFPIVIYRLFSEREAGFFYLPWMMFSAYGSFITCVGGVFLMKASNGGDAKIFLRKAIFFSTILAVIGIVFFGAGGPWVLGIFKKDFEVHSLRILRVLFLSLLFFPVHQIYIAWANIKKDTVAVSLVSVSLLVSVIFFSILWLPFQKSESFAWAWVAANAVAAFFVLSLVFRERLKMKRQGSLKETFGHTKVRLGNRPREL